MPHPVESAKAVGLHYVSDAQPGIRRLRSGRGFRYVRGDGRPIRERSELARFRRLAIPPAWTDVWICPDPRGHLQATGRDDKRRKQYRYHPQWRAARDETKYDRLIAFAHALPRIRARTDKHLRLRGLPRVKVLATVVRLLETTLIRVGNEEYARQNRSFGLTTMQDRHVAISGATLRFAFRGKSGLKHCIDVNDRRLARVVRRCRELPGYDLFQYLDEKGIRRDVTSGDVNDYLREITGRDFTAKDFRTWAGTYLAAMALQQVEELDSDAKRKSAIVRAVEQVAKHLGNTAAVCRKCYIHPAVFDGYLDGTLLRTLADRSRLHLNRNLASMSPEEAAVTAFLRSHLARLAKKDPKKPRRARRRAPAVPAEAAAIAAAS
jgi:DNA topoisomerase-1